MFITNPEDFAECFNERVPDGCRKITAEDVRLMTECGLICRYRYYDRQDLKIARGIFQFVNLAKNDLLKKLVVKRRHYAVGHVVVLCQKMKENPAGPGYIVRRVSAQETLSARGSGETGSD
jgi:hypothetical protein